MSNCLKICATISRYWGFRRQTCGECANSTVCMPDKPRLAPLVQENFLDSPSYHHVAKCKDDWQRKFYILMTKRCGWSKNVLIRQIENLAYEKTLKSDQFEATLPPQSQLLAKLAVKDELPLTFWNLAMSIRKNWNVGWSPISKHFSEKWVVCFTFAGSQYRLQVNDKEYFIDILLYRRLRCHE